MHGRFEHQLLQATIDHLDRLNDILFRFCRSLETDVVSRQKLLQESKMRVPMPADYPVVSSRRVGSKHRPERQVTARTPFENILLNCQPRYFQHSRRAGISPGPGPYIQFTAKDSLPGVMHQPLCEFSFDRNP